MHTEDQLIKCRGANCSIILYQRKMIINEGMLSGRSYDLPLERIRSVIVDRKSVIPFASATILATIFTLVTKYNALWFLMNLSSANTVGLSTIGLLACIAFAGPTIARAFFVNVNVNWDGQPASFHLGFVSVKRGRRLARRFQELSAGN
jgi:hypothetical protein